MTDQRSTIDPPPYEAVRFPKRFTIFRKTGRIIPSTCFVGTSEALPLNHISLKSGLVHYGKPHVTLHSGSDKDSSVLAFSKAAKWGGNYVLEIPGSNHEEPIIEKLEITSRLGKAKRQFCLNINDSEGIPHGRHEFQWRRSKGKGVRDLGLQNQGWKLVWLPGTYSSNSSQEEIVATWAQYNHWSFKKPFDFQFLGSGADGSLGEKWALMAVVSALTIWYDDITDH